MRARARPSEPPRAPADARAPRLLLVEDEPTIIDVLNEFLSAHGYQILVCSNGEIAIEQLPVFKPDLVITDLNLPGVSGLEVMRLAKSLDADAVVIVVTGNASTSSAIEALRQGAYDYVTKPFELLEVHQIIERGLASRRLQQTNQRLLEELRQANQTLQRHESELREKVALATWQMTTLYEVGKEISADLELEPRLRIIAEKACGLVGARGAIIYLRQEGSEEFHARAAYGLEPGADASFQPGVGLNGAAVFEQKAARHQSAPGAADLALPGFAERFFSVMALPMTAEGQLLGVLNVIDKLGNFSADDENFLSLYVAEAAIAILNSQLFERTKSLDRLKSEFVAVVSHEIRTPLTSIKGAIELLADSRYFQNTDQQGKLLAIAGANSERLMLLINDILDFSKLEANRLPMSRERQRLEPVIQQAVHNLRTLIEDHKIRVETQLSPQLPDVSIDAHRITQVVTNLLSNAIKFSTDGGEIEIAAEPWQGRVRVSVRDHGEGIATGDLPKLFQRFSQLDSSSTRKAGGTGLGLVISRGIIEQHDGQIWVESVLGQGSVFYFTLTAAPPLVDAGDVFESGSAAADTAR